MIWRQYFQKYTEPEKEHQKGARITDWVHLGTKINLFRYNNPSFSCSWHILPNWVHTWGARKHAHTLRAMGNGSHKHVNINTRWIEQNLISIITCMYIAQCRVLWQDQCHTALIIKMDLCTASRDTCATTTYLYTCGEKYIKPIFSVNSLLNFRVYFLLE